jgi:hypothetical protein
MSRPPIGATFLFNPNGASEKSLFHLAYHVTDLDNARTFYGGWRSYGDDATEPRRG